MNRSDFARLLAEMVARPVPPLAGRHVYLWHGEPGELRSLIPPGQGIDLDLYVLADALPRTPYAVDEARRLLQDAVSSWLRNNLAGPGEPRVVVVSGVSLLHRYNVPLEPFFQASNETRAIVFAVSPRETAFHPRVALPAYVELEPQAALAFLKKQLGEPAVIGEPPS
jgi:hypothetical protein